MSSWELVDANQDIRGRPVLSADGSTYGTVKDMLVNKEKEHVAAVRLGDGRLVAAEDLEIRERDVVYHNDAPASITNYTLVRRPRS